MSARRTPVAVLLTFSIACASCGFGTATPTAEVRPAIGQACTDANVALAALGDLAPTRETAASARDAIDALIDAIPDVDTEAGNPVTLVRAKAQQLARGVGNIAYHFERGLELTNPQGSADTMRDQVDAVNNGAASFGVDPCLDADAGETLVAQLDSLTTSFAEAAPTGDYLVDFVAACTTLQSEVNQLVASSLTEPNAEFTVLVQVRRLIERFGSSLERLDPPAEFVADHTELQLLISAHVAAVDDVESARLVSQDALDEALLAFETINDDLTAQIGAIAPACDAGS